MIWRWKRQPGQPVTIATAGESSRPHGAIASVAAALPDPVLLLDSHGIVRVANAEAQALFSIDPRGQHVSAAIRSPSILTAVTQVLETGETIRTDYEVHVPIPKHFAAVIGPVNAPEAGLAAMILLKDLTREQQTERMRADFVAHASHELRTPLASLLGFIETLQGAAKNDEASREKFLVLMQNQAERMKRLIDDLLSLSRIEMNAHQRPSDKVDLAQVARHVADTLSGLAKDADVEIVIRIEEPLSVRGDWDELVQVVQNLIENALKYAASGKRIEIEGRRDGDDVELSVRDFGPGIDEVHIPRLTERFYRINAQESRQRGGTGLGLAIVKHILNRHQARLKISSQRGHGSTFTVRVPVFGK
jgi:two-component system phosphate regulon sensor histidine kinase PhoR